MVTLSISQANATVVYYKNTNNWETPKAHMWNGGEATKFPGKAMTNLGDGWYSIDAGSNKNILFNNGSDNGKTISEDKNEYDYDTMVARYGNSDDDFYLLLRGFKQIKPSY